jgi:hypothetical protein
VKPKKYLWIVEMREDGKWFPTVGVGLTRADAMREMKDYWRENNRHDSFRVRKYTRDI